MDFKEIFKEWVLPFGAAIIVALLINQFAFFVVNVPSESMYPTIKIGDRMLATRVYNRSNLKRGDIVVFYSDELKLTLIKRLIGLPGDNVEVKESGEIYINGQKLDEPYVVFGEKLAKSFKVPEGNFLFMGDNRAVSDDSRRWENPYIPGEKIKGKAQFIIYPFSRFGKFVIGEEAIDR